ncbi:MAG TPA: hypothetical protein VGJ44_19210, partial [Kribbellaceae bacterium]
PDGPGIATALAAAAVELPDLADLLVGRRRLGEGLSSLLTRWTLTDGVVPEPTTVPSDVTSLVLEGFSYDELVAAGRLRAYVLADVAEPLDAVVHVGCEADWLVGHGAGTRVDATVVVPTPIPASDDGEWFVCIPAPATAAALRTDHDGVAAQADRLTAVLAARTAPVVMVAYGPAGAAAIRAAAAQPQVSAVVTVGTPWSPVALLTFTTGLGGDALRFLDRIVPELLPEITDPVTAYGCSPAQRGWALVRHSLETRDPSDLPSAGAETRRAGLSVHAVFGSVSAADAARAMGALVVGGVESHWTAADAQATRSFGPPEELHVGVDVPVLELDLGGLFVGAGAAIDLVSVNATTPAVRPLREVVATLRFGVTDGWLVGGPGASQNDLELRWLETRVHIPLAGGTGSSKLVLHEARAFTAYRERWVVNATGSGDGATTALPEVKMLLSELATRLRTASPDLAHLLSLLGILRSTGLDGDAVDQLLFDPVATIRPLVAAHAADIADTLRTLIGLPTTGLPPTAFRAGLGGFHVDVDLAAGTVTGSVTVSAEGLPPLTVDITASPAGASASAALGTIDADAGGVRLVGQATTTGATLAVEHRAPGAGSASSVALYPTVDVARLGTLARTALPAVVVQSLAGWCRSEASEDALAVLDAALDAVGLLGPAWPNGARDVVLPYGLVADPGAWLRLRSDPFGAVVAVMDALARVVVPDRAEGVAGWPLTDDLTVTYAVVAGRLQLAAGLRLSTTIDGRAVST